MDKQEATLIKQWYKDIKQSVRCVYCDHEGIDKEEPHLEFHHIDPASKTNCISNLIYPQPYNVTVVAVEFMKCVPMHTTCHAELHRTEKEEPQTFAARFDIARDERYRQLTAQFHQTVLALLPGELWPSLSDGVMESLETGKLRFDRGVTL